MKALIFQNKIVQVAAVEFEVAAEMSWIDCPDNCTTAWGYNNGVITEPVVVLPTQAEIETMYGQGVKAYMDSVAQQKTYSSSESCISYGGSTVLQWKNEADTFSAWRDSVWTYVYQELAKFQNGTRTLVPLEEFITEFPVIIWPV